jgi:hypothetical protein
MMETQDFWLGEDVIRSAGREGYSRDTRCVLIKVPVRCLICHRKANIADDGGGSHNSSNYFTNVCEHYGRWESIWEQAKTVNPDFCLQCLSTH